MTATLDTAAPYAPPDGCRPFLRTIAERPDDMGPRLVFADYLEEHGDPWGEFLRVGVELAKFSPDDWQARYNAGTLPPDHPISKRAKGIRGLSDEMLDRLIAYDHKKDTLKARRAELLARHGAAWVRVVLGGVWPDKDYLVSEWSVIRAVWSPDQSATAHVATIHWHGGLPTDFTLSLDAWMGRMCGGCGGNGNSAAFKDPGEGQNACHQCRGTGRVNALGPLLLAAAPVRVEGLRFAGKVPNRAGDWFIWAREMVGTVTMLHHRIPTDVFDMMDAAVNVKGFPTESAALDALARAAIAWATQQAKGAATIQ